MKCKILNRLIIGILCLSIILINAIDMKALNAMVTLFSSGVFHANKLEDNVNIDSRDLYNLQADLDRLEESYHLKAISALNGIGCYFDSSGNASTTITTNSYTETPTYSQIIDGISQSYSKGYADGLAKNQNKEGKIIYTYHKHSSTCYGTCGRAWVDATYDVINGPDGYGLNYTVYCIKCYYCGWGISFANGAHKWHWENGNTTDPIPYTRTCPNTVLKCGKTESTIESATIVFD